MLLEQVVQSAIMRHGTEKAAAKSLAATAALFNRTERAVTDALSKVCPPAACMCMCVHVCVCVCVCFCVACCCVNLTRLKQRMLKVWRRKAIDAGPDAEHYASSLRLLRHKPHIPLTGVVRSPRTLDLRWLECPTTDACLTK